MPNFRTEVIRGSGNNAKRNAGLVLVAPGLFADSPVRLYVDGDDLEYDLELDICATPSTNNRAGRFICQNLSVRQRPGGPAVTTEAIRAVPVATLVRGVGARHLHADEGDGVLVVLGDAGLSDELLARLRRDGPTDEVLTWVARIYRAAVVLGDPPTKAVEDTLGIPRSTAGRWIAAARGKHLGAVEGPGKAGG